MIGPRIYIKRGASDEGEKPFWISFSDLMTALMVVFLVVMSVALLSVTREISEQQKAEARRQHDIKELLAELKKAAQKDAFAGVTVHDEDYQNPYIDFGSKATFELDKSALSQKQARFLRSYIPEILTVADTEKGRRWFKQVVVEGYTDKSGTYLHNLDLSLRRSERVVCVLLARASASEAPLTDRQKLLVERLFLVGGYSSNSAKAEPALSRRIELKLKFWTLNDPERKSKGDAVEFDTDSGNCSLGAN